MRTGLKSTLPPLLLLLALPALAAAGEAAGVEVESVTPKSVGEAAGLRPGDLILSWSAPAAPPALLQPAGGPVLSPFDLVEPECEEAPRRPMTLLGKRGGQETSWRVAAGEWGIETRPAGPAPSPAWTLSRRARELGAAGKWPEADAAYAGAVAGMEKEGAKLAAVKLLHEWAKSLDRRGSLDLAAERYRQALAIERSLAPKSLAEARTLNSLGVVTAKGGDYAGAETLLLQSLAIREELAPGTSEVTGSLNNLGILTYRRGDLDRALGYLTRGEELQRQIAPDSADHALFFQNLGNLSRARGELERSQSLQERALEIFEKIDPGGEGVQDALSNLANVTMERGDLALADDYLQRSFEIESRGGTDELNRALTLTIRGNLADRRGDPEAAEALYNRALEIQERLAPEGPKTAISLSNLGLVEIERGEFDKAREHLERALAIAEKTAPESLDYAGALARLARLEIASGGGLDPAEQLLRRAMAVYEAKVPGSLEIADVARDLGEITVRRGHPADAIALYRRALGARRQLAPGTTGEAEAYHLLGLAERGAGQAEAATHDLCAAIDVLDKQRARLGDTLEARVPFEAALGAYYHDCLESLVQAGKPEEAFRTVERGRARSFLALLSSRDLHLSDVPPELAAELRRMDAAYDDAQARLAALRSGHDNAEIGKVWGELQDLRSRQQETLARMRRDSPRSAALRDPQPLDLVAVRAALDPGTVLLEYAVGPEKAWLFVVQSAEAPGPGLSVYPIAAPLSTLRQEVESFRLLLGRPGSKRTTLDAEGRRLYRLLVQPAAGALAGARRIVISPDGPLHTLPFAALRRGDRYLVEWKPLHSVLSATVYAELTRNRPAPRQPGEERLVAFGDPVYPPSRINAIRDPQLREALRRGLTLTPLPSTRKEVQEIGSLFPERREYLGREATEERAKSLDQSSHLIHFACHGLIDPRFPLNSALALTVPEHPAAGQDNGLLQAWEIFESVRLDADLVTLSACDTALGREVGGEGLIGLTRAFQYAGAHSVLASLWGISDYSTAAFMKSFYGHLRAGKTKDEALRAAQLDQIRKKSGSHPFFWAAFQLTGDWR